MGREDDENVAVAFALVIGAGASTALGASVVFFPKLVKLASRKTLAGGLGLSAGVMVYVSFVEIFQKSVLAFGDASFDEDEAYLYATLCFFGGVVAMVLLNFIVHNLLDHRHGHVHGTTQQRQLSSTQEMPSREEPEEATQNETGNEPAGDSAPSCPCCSTDPASQLEQVHTMAQAVNRTLTEKAEEEAKREIHEEPHSNVEPANEEPTTPASADALAKAQENAVEAEQLRLSKEEAARLHRMSLKTAIAIALHNFPEGLATFVAALHDPAVGAVLAIAIAIHNIPEGLCVAMPVYYATGNRCRAFMWAVLSGISEPFAALLGWAVLANSFSDTLYGVLFGGVAGMMVIISVRELLPTAHRYDPEDKVVTNMFIVGMAIMAVSLVLFVV